MQDFLEMVKQTIERMNLVSADTSISNENTANPTNFETESSVSNTETSVLDNLASDPVSGNLESAAVSDNLATDAVSDNLESNAVSDEIDVIPPVIVNASAPHANEESFYDSLSDWQKAGVSMGIVFGAVAFLPEEIGAALLFGLGRLGTAMLPGVGPLTEAFAVDSMAGEAIAGTAAGAAAGNFFSKIMSKVGLFKSEMTRAINTDAGLITQEHKFYKNATLVSEHNFYNPGTVPPVLSKTFLGLSYKTYRLEGDVILYRAGSNEKDLRQFFSFEKPISELQHRIDKAIRHIWDKNCVSILESGYTVKIPKGTIVHVGETASQNNVAGEIFLGGTMQIFIETPWKILGVEVLEKFPLQEELLWNQIAKISVK